MRKFLILVFAFCILHSTFYITSAYAQEDNIGSARINASSPIYFLKAAREVLELKFAKTEQAKTLRYQEFATNRIREAKSLVGTSHEDLIVPALEQYILYWDKLNNGDNLSAQLNVLQEAYKSASDQKAKKSIRLTIFRLSEKFTSIRSAACSFLIKEASSSALSAVEKFVYRERATKCLQVSQQ